MIICARYPWPRRSSDTRRRRIEARDIGVPLEEGEELGRIHEFRMGVRSWANSAEHVFCDDDCEKVGEWGAGDG
jgi:hypothetical protein